MKASNTTRAKALAVFTFCLAALFLADATWAGVVNFTDELSLEIAFSLFSIFIVGPAFITGLMYRRIQDEYPDRENRLTLNMLMAFIGVAAFCWQGRRDVMAFVSDMFTGPVGPVELIMPAWFLSVIYVALLLVCTLAFRAGLWFSFSSGNKTLI